MRLSDGYKDIAVRPSAFFNIFEILTIENKIM